MLWINESEDYRKENTYSIVRLFSELPEPLCSPVNSDNRDILRCNAILFGSLNRKERFTKGIR